MRNKC